MKQNKSAHIKNVLRQAMASSDMADPSDDAVEKILEALDEERLFRYHRDNEVSLLSTAGRVLVALIEDNTLTLRAIAVYLDLSETMIDKTVKQLIETGLITKTKVNRQNVYRLNKDLIGNHSDIHHFLAAIRALTAVNHSASLDDEQPF